MHASITFCSFQYISPIAQDCLAPNVEQNRDRPDPRILDIRNTSVTLSLVAPPLSDHCGIVVISFPPVIFGINVEDSDQPIPGFPIVSNL